MTHRWESLPPGEAWRGWWEPKLTGVPALPILAARGKRDGPTVLVTGAVHGDEYEGPAAIHALFNDLDPARLSGLVIGLPVVNGAAWEARARVAPTDRLDLNRLFPGTKDAAGEPSRALAEALFEAFVRRCDALIDLHSGGAKLVHLPMIGWYAGSDEAERLARSFAQGMMPWQIGNVPGVLSYEAHHAGKIALGAEWGGGARLDLQGALTYATGLRRTLAHLAGEFPEPTLHDTRKPLAGKYQQTEQGGLFTAQVKLGEQVTPATTLGLLHSPLGEVVGEIKAERQGIVAALAHIALLSPGDRMAYIG
jgi:predicted deacylase